jgi:HD-GYP domain-containing protein (c-di-GMP phosphodiesterase class II)
MRIPVEELLKNPNARLVRDVLSQTGATVLIPSKIPIGKITEGLDNPNRMIESLKRMGVRNIDIEIPNEINDSEILERLIEMDSSISVIDSEVAAHTQSAVDDIYSSVTLDQKYTISKSEVEDLGKALANELHNVSQIAISLISSSDDKYTQSHAVNVSLLAGYIAQKLVEKKMAPASLIDKTVLSGLLFDVGKTRIPGEILRKKDALTPKEMEVMKNHIGYGVSICKEAGITDKEILEGIATHHERYDGSGYMRGMVGNQIPLIGRILAVADTFDAMTSPRVYKNAVSSKLAFNFIMSANETAFDPDICKIFIADIGVYPPGSTVQLSDGRIATVAAMTQGNLLQPKVTVIQDGRAEIVDLAKEKLFIKGSLDVEPTDEPDLVAPLVL